jgi:hypothetical protein
MATDKGAGYLGHTPVSQLAVTQLQLLPLTTPRSTFTPTRFALPATLSIPLASACALTTSLTPLPTPLLPAALLAAALLPAAALASALLPAALLPAALLAAALLATALLATALLATALLATALLPAALLPAALTTLLTATASLLPS